MMMMMMMMMMIEMIEMMVRCGCRSRRCRMVVVWSLDRFGVFLAPAGFSTDEYCGGGEFKGSLNQI
jgi:hypothetical protein